MAAVHFTTKPGAAHSSTPCLCNQTYGNRTQLKQKSYRLVSVIELTLKFGPLNKIESSIAERSTIKQNRTVDGRTQLKRAIIELLIV